MLAWRVADLNASLGAGDEEVDELSISEETLEAMIRDYYGLDLSDAELDMIRPELDNYIAHIETLRGMELSSVMSGRLLREMEGGTPGVEGLGHEPRAHTDTLKEVHDIQEVPKATCKPVQLVEDHPWQYTAADFRTTGGPR